MINSQGIVQNNKTVTDFLKKLKRNKVQYAILSKDKERELVESYVEKVLDDDGNEILDVNTKEYEKYDKCDDSVKKLELFYLVPRVLKWKKDEAEFRNLLIMHNIRMVFNLSKKHSKDTIDFDNMIAKGLYGLTIASNKFNPFRPIMDYDKTDPRYETDIKHCPKVPKVEDGKIQYTKFCTSARFWIFKYIMDEFEENDRMIENNSISMSDTMRISNTIDSKYTVENYIDNMVHPDYNKPKSMMDEISSNDMNSLYSKIGDYIQSTNELTSIEKGIVYETFYNGKKIKDIAEQFNINTQNAQMKKQKALLKLRGYLKDNYGINSICDISF